MAYTGRLANPDARPGNIKLALADLVVLGPGTLPDVDLPTTVTFHRHTSTLAVHRHTSTLSVSPHRTTVTLD